MPRTRTHEMLRSGSPTGKVEIPMLTFGSVCSGIEAASVAWEPLGWRAVWLAEVDRAASNVLAHRFPTVPNLGDMTKIAEMVRRREVAAPDVLVGGTPCQSYSVAGRRQGLSDPRGALTLAYLDLADAIDAIRAENCLPPCIIVWENVPGVLSSKDNAFGCFLAGLAGEDCVLQSSGKRWTNAGVVLGPERSVAWRTLDAQYAGLAQRRRRVFVVASAVEGFDPASVLLEFDGVRRDSPPSRSAWQETAGAAGACVEDGSGIGRRSGAEEGSDVRLRGSARVKQFAHETSPTLKSSGCGVARIGDIRGQDPVVGVVGTLEARTSGGGFPGTDGAWLPVFCMAHGQGGAEIREDDLAPTLTCNHEAPIAFTTKDDGGDATADLAPTLRSMAHFNAHANGGGQVGIAYSVALRGRDGGASAEIGDDCAYALRASSGGGDKPYVLTVVHGTQDPCIANDVAFALGRNSGGENVVCITGDITHPLRAEGFDASEDGTGRGNPIVPCGFQSSQSGVRISDVAGTLDANYGSRRHNGVLTTMAVRRLMPIECERLQGFPDNWTLVPTGPKQKPSADGPRYKQLGNSMAVNVMRWIGQRIDAAMSERATMIGHNSFDYEELLG